MNNNILEQLAEQTPPPAPPELSRGVHEKLNVRLLWQHLADVAISGLPYAFVHGLKAFFGAVVYSVKGRD